MMHRHVLALCLQRHLPDYARDAIDLTNTRDPIDWDKLVAPADLYSSGELALIALAAHIDDRPGVVRGFAVGTFTDLLGRLTHETRFEILEALRAYEEEVLT